MLFNTSRETHTDLINTVFSKCVQTLALSCRVTVVYTEAKYVNLHYRTPEQSYVQTRLDLFLLKPICMLPRFKLCVSNSISDGVISVTEDLIRKYVPGYDVTISVGDTRTPNAQTRTLTILVNGRFSLYTYIYITLKTVFNCM